jgi:hypothetical protein
VVSSIPRPQLLTELRAPAGRWKPPFTQLVRGVLALLAFCDAFWAAAVSGAAVAANPRHRATARREGARAHSYASRGATSVPWASRSGHTMASRGAHGGASAPWGLEATPWAPQGPPPYAHLLLRREIPHGCRRALFLRLGHSAQPPVALSPNLRKASRCIPRHP